MKRVPLSEIVFDAGTQIRAAIDQQTVSDYAEAMTDGAVFPPIVLFHDGTQHFLADGFHRYMAAQRIELREIDADVRAGTKEDALWFALGANRTNGKRLSEADKSHAIALARAAWPERMQREIAEQVGCHPALVSRVYQKMNGSETVLTGRALRTQQKRAAIKELVQSGASTTDIARRIGVSRSSVSEVTAELGMSTRPELTRAAVLRRHDQMRDLAAQGYTSIQIAGEVGLSIEGCRAILRQQSIQVPADRATARTKRHDANRIVDAIVAAAENLVEGSQFINYDSLDRSRLAGWVQALEASRANLNALIRKLKEALNGQAA